MSSWRKWRLSAASPSGGGLQPLPLLSPPSSFRSSSAPPGASRSIEKDKQAQAQQASSPIEGVQTYDNLTREHVDGAVDYSQSPPAGGDHSPAWFNCGTYDDEVSETSAVHSLEHGAVWVTYQPDIPDAQVSVLDEVAGTEDYALVSPYEGQETPVVATAWGVQLELEDAGDERLQTFLTKYLQGPQTLEPGAACTGGLSG